MSGIVQGLIASLKSAAAATTDTYFNLVALLLNTTSTNGAQNNTFQDSSSNGYTITRAPLTGPLAPSQGTFSPYSQTGWSNFFPASGSYLTVPASSDFAPGTGDFTVDGWIFTGSNTLQTIFAQTVGGTNYFVVEANAPINRIQITSTASGGGTAITSAATLVLNEWNYFCVSRTSGTVTVWCNGSAGTPTSNTHNLTNTTYVPTIGTYSHATTTNPLIGYLSNLRYIKGTALSGATVPTAPFATNTANQSLLTCQSNRFFDGNTTLSAKTLSVAGTPSVQAFEPFAPGSAYSTTTIGGSGYFDRSGDYLDVSSNSNLTIGTSDFTIAMWLYFNVIDSTTQVIFEGRPSSSADNVTPTITYSSVTNSFVLRVNGANLLAGAASVTKAGQWYYLVVSRLSGTSRLFINGAEQDSEPDANNYVAFASDRPRIAERGNNNGTGSAFGGYISGLQILVGTGYSSVTVPTAPPTNIANTQLLLNFTNAGIYDATAKNNFETLGNAQVSTTQVKFGTTAIAFDGTGDYLEIEPYPGNLSTVFNNGPWTIEFWFYTSSTTRQAFIDTRASTASATGLTFYVNPTTPTLGLQINSIVCTSTTTVPQNAWNYIAVTSTGGTPATATIYLNGVSVASGSTSQTITDQYLRIGATAGTAASFVNGYMDEIRITKGVARTITTPTAAFPVQ